MGVKAVVVALGQFPLQGGTALAMTSGTWGIDLVELHLWIQAQLVCMM